MGCAIESWVEIYDLETNRWTAVWDAFPSTAFEKGLNYPDFVWQPFRTRDYGLFGFLAGVRNFSCCEPLLDGFASNDPTVTAEALYSATYNDPIGSGFRDGA